MLISLFCCQYHTKCNYATTHPLLISHAEINVEQWFILYFVVPFVQQNDFVPFCWCQKWKERNCTCCCLRELRWQLAVYSRAERWLAGHPTTAASLIITGRQNIRSFYFISCICVTSPSMALILLCTSFKNRPDSFLLQCLVDFCQLWQKLDSYINAIYVISLQQNFVESAFFL